MKEKLVQAVKSKILSSGLHTPVSNPLGTDQIAPDKQASNEIINIRSSTIMPEGFITTTGLLPSVSLPIVNIKTK